MGDNAFNEALTTKRGATPQNAFVQGRDVFGVPIRQPYPSEDAYFRQNPNVAGMAAEDNAITLNPYASLSDDEKMAVAKNEAARVWMRDPAFAPFFDITEDQAGFLGGTSYAGAGIQDRRATIAGRLFSGDPSAGAGTDEQLEFIRQLRAAMGR